MAAVNISSDLRAYLVADFSNEVSFGIRNVPQALTQCFGYNSFVMLLHVPLEFDIHSLMLLDVSFEGTEEEADEELMSPSGPIRMSRNVSLEEQSLRPSIPRKMQRSLSSIETKFNKRIFAPTGNHSRRPGTVRLGQQLSTSRTLLFIIGYEPTQGFVPIGVDFAIGSGDRRSNIRLALGSFSGAPFISIATLYRRNLLERTEPKYVYSGLLDGLRGLVSAAPPLRPNAEISAWFHGAILSFVRSYVSTFNFSFRIMPALECLCEAFDNRSLPSWLIMIAVGHAAGTLQSDALVGRDRWIQFQRIRNLWRLPQHLLQIRGQWLKAKESRTEQQGRAIPDPEEYLILNSLAVRTALFFLSQEDASANNYFPSYVAYSGAIPLMHCLRFSHKGSFSLSYPSATNSLIEARQWATKTIERLAAIPADGNCSFDHIVTKLTAVPEGERNAIMNDLNVRIESASLSLNIWKAAASAVEAGAQNQEILREICRDMVQKLCDDNLPQFGSIRTRKRIEIQSEFEVAVTTCQLLQSSPEMSRDASINFDYELSILQQSLVECRELLDTVGNKLTSYHSALSQWFGLVRGTSSVSTSTLFKIKDIERVFFPSPISSYIAVQQDVAAGYPFGLLTCLDSTLNGQRKLECIKALCVRQNTGSLMLLADNMMVSVESMFSDSRTIVAGSSAPSFAGTTRATCRFNNPEGICNFQFGANATEVGSSADYVISDTGNHCIRICQFSQADRIVNFGDRRISGHFDGLSADAMFNGPSGVAPLGDSVIICDAGNHCLRKLSLINNEFVVTTVAGCPMSPGNSDGYALRAAKLTFPSHIVTAPDGMSVYFVEEGANPAIRMYSESREEVTTVLRGAPLITPGSLCFADENTLLVCDVGASCIWSLDLRSCSLSKKISSLNIFLVGVEMHSEINPTGDTPAVGGTRDSSVVKSRLKVERSSRRVIPTRFMNSSSVESIKFGPVAIVKVLPGCFIFAAITSQRLELFRYVDRDTVEIEKARLSQNIHEQLIPKRTHMFSESSILHSSLQLLTNKVFDALAVPIKLKAASLERNFVAELDQIDRLSRNLTDAMNITCLNTALYLNMLKNAPNLHSVSVLVTGVFKRYNATSAVSGGEDRWFGQGMRGGILGGMLGLTGLGGRNAGMGADIFDDHGRSQRLMELEQMQQGLVQFFSDCDFSSPHFVSDRDLFIILTSVNASTREMCLRTIFNNSSFNYPVTITMLDLISRVVGMNSPEERTSGRGSGRALREPVLLWLSRLTDITSSTNVNAKVFTEICSELLDYWRSIRTQYSSQLTPEDKEPTPFEDLVEEMDTAQRFEAIMNQSRSNRLETTREERLTSAWVWLVYAHLDTYCNEFTVIGQSLIDLGEKYYFKDVTVNNKETFLQNLPSLCVANDDMKAPLVSVAITVCQRLTPPKAIATLLAHYPKTMNKYLSVFIILLESMWEYSVAEFRKRNPGVNPGKWEVCFLLLEVYPGFWTKFVEWGRSPKYESSNRYPTESQRRLKLQDHVNEVVDYMRCTSETVCRGQVTVRELNAVVDSFDDLLSSWELIGSPLANPASDHYFLKLRTSMDSCCSECKTLIQIMTALMPDCEELQILSNFAANWDHNLLVTVRKVLVLEQPDNWNVPAAIFREHFGLDYLVDKLNCKPLPEMLVYGVDWLSQAVKSDAFKLFWQINRCYQVSDLHRILPTWREFLGKILDKSVSLNVLDLFGDTLLSGGTNLLVSTAWGLKIGDDKSIEFALLSPKECEPLEAVVNKCAAQWKHIREFYLNKEHAFTVLVAARNHLKPAEHHHLNSAEASLRNLCTEIDKNGTWSSQSLAEFDGYWPHARNLDSRLLRISYPLLFCIQQNSELIDWLRSINDDENFSSSLDIARSLQEMNCPIDLWDARSQPGRINEKYLSSISNIRDYLYAYLYSAEHQVASIEMFMTIFSDMNAKNTAMIIDNIDVCNVVRTSLASIIGIKTDFSGSSRLGKLYSDAFGSIWRCQKLAGLSSDGSVALRYQVDDANGNKIWRQHAATELVEFQSNLVLERTGVAKVNSDENILIEKFLSQCGWMRRLSEAFVCLHASGHFDFYPYYSFEISVSSPESQFQDKVYQLEYFHDDWNQHIKRIRSRYYFINYFDLKRCYHLKCLLNRIVDAGSNSDAASVELRENFPELLKNYLCFLNCERASDMEYVKTIGGKFVHLWSAIKEEKITNDAMSSHEFAKNEITQLASVLENLLAEVPRRKRPCSLHNIDRSVVNERITRGIHVAQGQTVQGVYDQLLTLFAIHGEFGEWENVLCCSRQTTLEQAMLLIYRWYRSHEFNRQGSIYAMVEVDKLSYEIQHSCVQMLRELGVSGGSTGPLILITESFENCHITSQFSHNRISVGILPPLQLGNIGNILKSYGFNENSLQCYTSTIPGSGKSFQIRLMAGQSNMLYAHIPINSPYTSVDVLIHRIRENLIRSSSCSSHGHSAQTLHFDIASTAGSTLISPMFALCLFGILADSTTESTYFYDPMKTVLCLELSAGLHLGVFSQMNMYPQVNCVVNSSAIILDAHSLRLGMGDEFHAVLYSPLSAAMPGHGSSEIQRTAVSRLHYVLNCLQVLNEFDGSFLAPPDALLGEFRGTPAMAFHLLVKACGLNDNPSLWCMWAFVNVLCWQLQQIQDETSPVYLACLPDIGIKLMTYEFDVKMKARVKGEMISFLIKTSREFATRQSTTTSCDPMRVVGAIVRNYSGIPETALADINKLFWTRESYDNDGRPVFKSPSFRGTAKVSRTYYIHYRECESRWVLDDTVNYTGGVIAYSSSDGPLEDVKFEKRSVAGLADIQVSLKYFNKGKPGERIEIRGFEKCQRGLGSVISEEENGIYYRLSPDQDIDGQPHYFKNDKFPRHLYYMDTAEGNIKLEWWVIGKTCNVAVMGSQASTRRKTPLVESDKFVFQYYRPNTLEDKMTVEIVTAGEAATKLAGYAQLQAIAEGVKIGDDTVDRINASLESAGLGVDLIRWRDSNHECMMFNNSSGNVTFLSQNPDVLIQNMHPVLLKHLRSNNISVGENLKVLSDKHWEILSSLTGVQRSREEAMQLVDESFCLTGDSLLKILAIVCRSRCKVPVVLLGECGCGKTMLLNFLCKWLGVTLLNLDVHGGTTEEEIIGIFDKATTILMNADLSGEAYTVFVFLDEVNTCAHMGLLNEAICHRSIYGRRLHDGIQILAALNPYRLRPKKEEMGLTFNLGSNPLEDPMKKLVYRVHPIPPTLKDYIFDFGNLEPDTEALYIHSMVANFNDIQHILGNSSVPLHCAVISKMIGRGQEFVRSFEGDPSVVSLRDVKRVLILLRWFHDELPDKQTTSSVSPIARATILALAHVYCYRLSSATVREEFWDAVSHEIRTYFESTAAVEAFQAVSVEKAPQRVVAHAQKLFVDNLDIEDGISMNEALSENLFVSIICILNKIPIFIVGKPGTSKTLAIQVIASNLRGDKSSKPFWHDKPAVHIFQYQCSPLSTSNSIKYQFESAKSFQEHASNVLTVLLLDEVGLAENSPDMPLKVLHYMLVDPPVAIVGLSNWALDSSKMNRAICLQRPEPSEMDIMLTGRSIVATDDNSSGAGASAESSIAGGPSAPSKLRRQNSRGASAKPWLGPLAKVFHEIYTQQRVLLKSTRDFIGMRDYYGLLKFLRVETYDKELSPDLLATAVGRNFGGRPDTFETVLGMFLNACFPKSSTDPTRWTKDNIARLVPGTLELIKANLNVSHSQSAAYSGQVHTDCRHLMLLSQNENILQLLFGCNVVKENQASVLIGSKFKDDLDELHLIQQIIKVKQAMAEGKTAILLHNDNIYESLYDLLNQRYVKQRDPDTKNEVRMLRLAMGSKSQLCPVHDNFKLIIIVQQNHAYEKLDLPLLNRFEKQVLSPADLLTPTALDLVKLLDRWCQNLLDEVSMPTMTSIFCGFTDDTLSSLVLSLTEFCAMPEPWNLDELLRRAKLSLLKMAAPIAILHSKALKGLISESFALSSSPVTAVDRYIKSRSHLFALLELELKQNVDDLIFLSTRAPVHQFEIALANWIRRCSAVDAPVAETSGLCINGDSDVITLQLAHVASERTLSFTIDKFYASTSPDSPRVLTILSDPFHCPASTISHAREIVLQGFRTRKGRTSSGVPRIVLFVIHLPPGVSSRIRDFKLDLYPPWNYMFLDELVDPADVGLPDLMKLLTIPLYELCTDKTLVNVEQIIKSSFQTAMRFCSIPTLQDSKDPRNEVSYVKMIKDLLEQRSFVTFVQDSVFRCVKKAEQNWLKDKKTGMELHVYRACENVVGSLRQSLQLTVEGIIIQAFSHILRQMDTNYNLSLLFCRMETEDFLPVWLGMANIMLPPDIIAANCVHDLTLPSPITAVSNSGLGGAFACRFAFSDRIINQLHNAIQNAPDKLGNGVLSRSRSLNSLLKTALSTSTGSYADTCVPRILSKDSVAYLYDFVASTIYPMPSIDLNLMFIIVKSFLSAGRASLTSTCTTIEFDPGMVHSLYWLLETRIYHFMSIVSRLFGAPALLSCRLLLSDDFEVLLMDNLTLNCDSPPGQTLKFLDANICKFAIDSLYNSLFAILHEEFNSPAVFNQDLSKWVLLFNSILSDVEALITLLVTAISGADDVNDSLTGIDESPILRKLWFLKLVNAVIATATSVGDTSTFGPSFLIPLIEIMNQTSYDPTSVESFRNFQALCSLRENAPYASILLQAYLKKFLVTEFDLLRRTNRAQVMSPGLLSLIGDLCHAQTEPSTCAESHSSVTPPVSEADRISRMMTLNRSAIDILFKAYQDQSMAPTASTVITTLILSDDDAKSLRFLQLFLERVAVQVENDVSRNRYLFDASMCNELTSAQSLLELKSRFLLSENLHSNSNRNGFVHLARAKAGLKLYTADIWTAVRSSGSKAEYPPVPNEAFAELLISDLSAQVFVLTSLLKLGGKNLLIQYLRQPNPPVVPRGSAPVDPQAASIKLLDPFSMLCDYSAYSDACTAIIQLHQREGIEAIDRWSKGFVKSNKASSWTDKVCLLLAAIHTQLGQYGNPLSNEVIETVMSWLRSDFAASKSSTSTSVSVNLYADMIRNGLRKQNFRPLHLGDNQQSLLDNLRLHVSMLASTGGAGWLHTLLTDPESLKSGFIPGMLDDELAALMMFIDERGNVQDLGWYECPNGHRYAVGECTLPMQESRCPECKAPIGGRSHTAVAGVKRLGRSSEGAMGESKQGYLASVTVGPNAHNISRLGKLTTIVLRLFQHLVMLTSSLLYPSLTSDMRDGKCGAKSVVGTLLYPDSTTTPDNETVELALVERIQCDWTALLAMLGKNEEDVAMGLHMIINRLYFQGEVKYALDGSSYGRALTDEQIAVRLDQEMRGVAVRSHEAILRLPPANMSPKLRIEFEQFFEKHYCEATLSKQGAFRKIQLEKLKFEDVNVDATLRHCLGDNFLQVMEIGLPPDPVSLSAGQLWRYHEVVSFGGFQQQFMMNVENSTRYPVIAAVLKNENLLPKIKYIVDILAWQAIVFKVLKPGTISREQSTAITNQDVVNMLPEEDQTRGQKCLERFCFAFNETIILPGMLIGCTPNIFRTENFEPDISGGTSEIPIPMNCNAPIAFTLPSVVTIEVAEKRQTVNSDTGEISSTNNIYAEYKDPKSLCPIFILESLKVLQQDIVATFLAVLHQQPHDGDIGDLDDTPPQALLKPRDQEKSPKIRFGPATSKEYHVPLTTYQTPPALVARRLLSYDREEHLMPLIYAYSNQHLEFGRGELIGYDYVRIENDLRFALMPTIQPVALATGQFTFSDELNEAGGIKLLAEKIKQEELPSSLLDKILDEVDLHHRYSGLMKILDDCVAFLLFFLTSSSTMNGETKVMSFIQDAMMVSTSDWQDVSCPSINKEVCLKHLKSLINGLDNRQHGGEFYLLGSQYRQPLTSAQFESLRACCQQADICILRESLRDFIDYLSKNPVIDPSLKNNLTYMNADLCDSPWFENGFPEDIEVIGAYSAYQAVKSFI